MFDQQYNYIDHIEYRSIVQNVDGFSPCFFNFSFLWWGSGYLSQTVWRTPKRIGQIPKINCENWSGVNSQHSEPSPSYCWSTFQPSIQIYTYMCICMYIYIYNYMWCIQNSQKKPRFGMIHDLGCHVLIDGVNTAWLIGICCSTWWYCSNQKQEKTAFSSDPIQLWAKTLVHFYSHLYSC